MTNTYPKIQTLWNRDKTTFKVIPGEFRKPEFALVKRWLFTEKIDGSSTRVLCWLPHGKVEIRGRTDKAQFRPDHLKKLESMFPPERIQKAFDFDDDGTETLVVLYGEHYGPKIQRGGKYRSDLSFRLFDVRVGEWWLQWDDVVDVANKLGILHVPVVGCYDSLPTCYAELEKLIPQSSVAFLEAETPNIRAEGIVARTDPILCDRRGQRIFFKLKFRDFQK